MRVRLNLLLDCPPDAAWEAVHSPAVFQAVSGPITTAQSLEADGFPDRWADTEHRVLRSQRVVAIRSHNKSPLFSSERLSS